MKFSALIYRDENKHFIAECVDLPGCFSDGKTRAEALKHVKEAIEGYLESMIKHGESLPVIHKPELVSVSV